MLTRDFSDVKKIAPELFGIVGVIEKFLKSIPTMNHIEPGRMVRMYKVNPNDLHLALEIARDQKLVKRSFGVLSPTNRCHAIGYWDHIKSIPDVLHDTADDRFEKDDGQLIVVYRDPDAEDGE